MLVFNKYLVIILRALTRLSPTSKLIGEDMFCHVETNKGSEMKQTISMAAMRIQPLHKGHYQMICQMLANSDKIVLVLGSAQEAKTENNPFTPQERVEMLRILFGKSDKIKVMRVADLGATIPGEWIRHLLLEMKKIKLPAPTHYYGGSKSDLMWVNAFNDMWAAESDEEIDNYLEISNPGVQTQEKALTVESCNRHCSGIMSATEIRKCIACGDDEWKEHVPGCLVDYIEDKFPKELTLEWQLKNTNQEKEFFMNIAELTEKTLEQYVMNDERKKNTIDDIREWARNYASAGGLKAFVIGISGGLDSAVCAALLQEKYTGVPLIGLSIPVESSETHIDYSERVGREYCSEFRVIKAEETEATFSALSSVTSVTDDMLAKTGIEASVSAKVRQGNLKARMRMIILYDLARKANGLVVSTDNYSELMAGFWTICGDVGDMAPIQEVWKGLELPQLAEALGIDEDIITQEPSDGLQVTAENTDRAQLGVSYPEFDAIIHTFTNGFDSVSEFVKAFPEDEQEKVLKVIRIHKNTAFKRTGQVNFPIRYEN